jgi:hypothetical protein
MNGIKALTFDTGGDGARLAHRHHSRAWAGWQRNGLELDWPAIANEYRCCINHACDTDHSS